VPGVGKHGWVGPRERERDAPPRRFAHTRTVGIITNPSRWAQKKEEGEGKRGQTGKGGEKRRRERERSFGRHGADAERGRTHRIS